MRQDTTLQIALERFRDFVPQYSVFVLKQIFQTRFNSSRQLDATRYPSTGSGQAGIADNMFGSPLCPSPMQLTAPHSIIGDFVEKLQQQNKAFI